MSKKLCDLKQRLRKDKKGFTLVELIVVLVILAILIALLIPTLTGYIDNANKKKAQSEGRQVLMAAQTLAEDDYSYDDETARTMCGKGAVPLNTKPAGANDVKDPSIETLAEVEDKYEVASVTVSDAGKVTDITYSTKKFTAVYTNGRWKVTKK